MNHHLAEDQRSLEHFAHQEIKREERTGGTPDRRNVNSSSDQTLSPLPTLDELLKRTERTPQRPSAFRIRDSILDQTLPDSPLTLKQKLPSSQLANVNEQED